MVLQGLVSDILGAGAFLTLTLGSPILWALLHYVLLPPVSLLALCYLIFLSSHTMLQGREKM